MTPELPAEVWLKVLEHLRLPLPVPNGKNPRSSITQGDLATCLRINKLFHYLAGPILYRVVVTDRIPLLVQHIDSDARAAGIRSKRQLLGLTQRLYFEYGDKGEQSYLDLFRYRGQGFGLFDPSLDEMDAFCRYETLVLTAAYKKLAGKLGSLIGVSTGAFLDSQSEIWEPVWAKVSKERESAAHAEMIGSTTALSALVKTPHLSHCCNRVAFGPLTFNTTLYTGAQKARWAPSEKGPKSFAYRAHNGYASFVGSEHSRWFFDFEEPGDADPLASSIAKVVHAVERVVWVRKHCWETYGKEKVARWIRSNPITVDIYVPAHMTAPPGGLEYVQQKLDETIKRWKHCDPDGDAIVPGDSFRVMKGDQAPPCEACLWTKEDM